VRSGVSITKKPTPYKRVRGVVALYVVFECVYSNIYSNAGLFPLLLLQLA
jgi:hypothetical protein